MSLKYPTLALTSTAATAMTYTFRASDRFGWAICTVNDVTGELVITSDWGNWSHVWNPRHLGRPSLTHFIGDRADYDYLANKLLGRANAWVLDADATIKQWRKDLVEQRLEAGRRYAIYADVPEYLRPHDRQRDPLTASRAREIWEALEALLDDEQNESIFIEHATQIDGFSWISEEPWEYIVHKASHAYRVLTECILPALAEACRLEAATRPGGEQNDDAATAVTKAA